MIFSGSHWLPMVFWKAISRKGWDKNNATAGESMDTDLCTAFCILKIHVFVLGTTGNL